MTSGHAALVPVSTGGAGLFERDDAIRRLRGLLQASTVSGRIAAISGEAGVGKTALIEAVAAAESRRASFLWGGCEALDTPRPLGPLLDISIQLDEEFQGHLSAGAPRHEMFAAFAAALGRRAEPLCVVFELSLIHI